MNKKLKEYICCDTYNYGKQKFCFKSIIWAKIKYPALEYIYIFRKANYYKTISRVFYIYYRWRLYRLSLKLGYQINVDTTIGKGFYLGHRGSVVVNGKAKLGDWVFLANGVTIGQENRGKRIGVPTLGNKVWVGANAVVVGNIKIGNDVLIAPNAYVNFDVPDHSIVIGNPAKVIFSENATKGYILELKE